MSTQKKQSRAILSRLDRGEDVPVESMRSAITALAKRRPKQYAAYDLDAQGYTQKQIAAMLEITQPAVAQRLESARRTLDKLLCRVQDHRRNT